MDAAVTSRNTKSRIGIAAGAVLCLSSPLWATAAMARWALVPFTYTGALVGFQVGSVLRNNVILTGLLAGVVIAFRAAFRLADRWAPDRPAWIELLSHGLQIVAFFGAAGLFASMVGATEAPAIAAVLTAAFTVVFPVSESVRNANRPRTAAALVGAVYLILLGGWVYLLWAGQMSAGFDYSGNTPTPLNVFADVDWLVAALAAVWVGLVLFAGAILPRRRWVRSGAIVAGRVAVCLVGFPLVTGGFLANGPEVVSPEAVQMTAAPNLHGLRIDPVGGRLIVSTKRDVPPGLSCFGFCFRLDDPDADPVRFRVPTPEFESFALDPERRLIYHVTRDDPTLLVLDADTFDVVRSQKVEVRCKGSTSHALVVSENRLFVRCEKDSLISFDTATLSVIASRYTGVGTGVVADERHHLLYVAYDDRPMLEALDFTTLQTVTTAPGPLQTDEMIPTRNGDRLYVPAAAEGEIWVYATPALRRIGTLPARFGVRAVALDETNGVMAVGNYVRGVIDIYRLDDGKIVRTYAVPRYGRTIVADSTRRQLYLTTTKHGLYRVSY